MIPWSEMGRLLCSPPLKSPSPFGEGIGVRPWARGGVGDIYEVVWVLKTLPPPLPLPYRGGESFGMR